MDKFDRSSNSLKFKRYQGLVLVLTFLSYTCYHMSRKPASIVKSVMHPQSPKGKTSYDPDKKPGWPPFNRDVVPEVASKGGYKISEAGYGAVNGKYDCTVWAGDVCRTYRMEGKKEYELMRSWDKKLLHQLQYTDLDSCWVIRGINGSKDCHHAGRDCVFYGQGSDSLLPSPGAQDLTGKTHEYNWKKVYIPSGDADDNPTVVPRDTNGKVLLGTCDTVYLAFYAIGMFFTGHLADHLNLKWFLATGMVLSGCFVMLLGMAKYWNITSLWYFLGIYAIQGICQSTGWPAVVAIVGRWCGKGTRGLVMGIWNAHTSVGNILGSVISSAALGIGAGNNWPMAFLIPGGIMTGMGIIEGIFLVVEPAEVGLETEALNAREEETDIVVGGEGINTVEENPHKRKGFLDALRIPGVVEFALCLAFAKLVAYTFIYWLPYYLGHLNYSSEKAGFLSSFVDVGGIIGGIVAGFTSDRLGKRASVAYAFLIACLPALFFYRLVTSAVRDTNTFINILAMLVVGACVNGPYALITTAVSADLGTHPNLKGDTSLMATVTAIIDGTGSIGASLQGVLIGQISAAFGWNAVFYVLMIACVLSSCFVLRLMKKECCGRPEK